MAKRKKWSQEEVRVQCGELDAAFGLSDERAIRDALFALLPKVRRVVDAIARMLHPDAPPLVWQADEMRQGSNGPTEQYELSCRANALPGMPAAAVSALFSFHNPYTGGGCKLEAQIDGTGEGRLYSVWIDAYPTSEPRQSFRVKFTAPLTENAVAAAFSAEFEDARLSAADNS